jgi:hypothetical protein
MTFNATQRIVITVNNNNGKLTNVAPLTLRNQIQNPTLNSIEDLPDVAEVSVTDGATLVYNANNDLYEVKQLIIDGGEF